MKLAKSFSILFRNMTVLLAASLVVAGCTSKSKSQSTDPQVSGGDPWFTAVRLGDVAVLQGMMSGGKDINTASTTGATALMVASRNGSVEVVKWLLSNGADATRLDQQQQSALVYALVGNASGVKRERIVETLIQAGADPFKYDAIGFQPLRQMIDLEMNDQVKKMKFTKKKPCDLVPQDPQLISLARAARQADNIPLAEFFEKEGCW